MEWGRNNFCSLTSNLNYNFDLFPIVFIVYYFFLNTLNFMHTWLLESNDKILNHWSVVAASWSTIIFILACFTVRKREK